jgi:cell wall-associated NlpC family hydrolase
MVKNGIHRLLLCACLLGICGVKAQSFKPVPTDSMDELTDTSESVRQVPQVAFQYTSTKVDSLIQHAYTFLGNRYRRGGAGKRGFDCSGYTMTVFKNFDIKLPHTSAGQGLMGIEISRTNIKKGDLIFFRGRGRRKSIGHVGIVISEKGQPVRFIHSSTSEGVRIDRMEFEYYRKRYIKTVRIPQLYK